MTDNQELRALLAPTMALFKRVAQAYANAFKPIADAITEVNREATPLDLRLQQLARLVNDQVYIRRVADRERAAAGAWLDAHMDAMYEDLGLERPR